MTESVDVAGPCMALVSRAMATRNERFAAHRSIFPGFASAFAGIIPVTTNRYAKRTRATQVAATVQAITTGVRFTGASVKARDQAIPGPFTILGIAGEVSHKITLLVDEAHHDRGHEWEAADEAPCRAEGQRHAEDQDECASIHRVANDAIWTSRDHRLVGGYLDDARCVAIFAKHEKDDEEADQDQTIARQDDRHAHVRPAKPVVEARDHDQR